MKIKIQTIHFDAGTKLVEYTNKKVSKLEKYYDNIKEVEVLFKVVKPETQANKEVAIKVVVPNAGELYANRVCDTFEEAVLLTVDAVKAQLVKYKEKNREK